MVHLIGGGRRIGIRKNKYFLTNICTRGFHSFSSTTHIGEVYASGVGINGALGNSHLTKVVPLEYPEPVEDLKGLGIKSVGCGWGHSAVVSKNGQLYLFGRTHDFQNTLRLGRLWIQQPNLVKLSLWFGAARSIDYPKPVQPKVEPEAIFSQVVCSAGVTAAISEEGVVYMLGSNKYGQCGIGTREPYIWEAQPLVRIPDPVLKIASGFQHSVALTEQGEVFAWGKGERGQLGVTVNELIQTSPQKLKQEYFANDAVVDIATGFNSSAALTDAGKVYVWGKFQSLGLDAKGFNHADAPLPRQVIFPNATEKIEKIYAGQFYFLAQDEKGKLWMWGMLPDGVAAAEFRLRFSQDNSTQGVQSGHVVESGADRTIHTPFQIPIAALQAQGGQVFPGHNRFFISRPNSLVAIDWNVSPTEVQVDLDDQVIQQISEGWMHSLIVAS